MSPIATIGLIGITNNKEVMEYYSLLQKLMLEKFENQSYFQIAVYCIMLDEDEDEDEVNVVKLYNAILNLLQTPVNTILFCNHELEIIVENINEKMPGISNVLQSGISVAKILNQKNIKKILVFDISLSQALSFYTSFLVSSGIQVFALDEKERKFLSSLLKQDFTDEAFSITEFRDLKNKLSTLSKRGVEAILIDTEELQKFSQYLNTDVPVFYTKYIHAQEGLENIILSKKNHKLLSGVSHP